MSVADRAADLAYAAFCERGDPQDLAAVYDATADRLLRAAMHLAPSPTAAEDLVQATFVAAIENAGRFDRSRPVLPWLLGILARQAKLASWRESRTPTAERLAWPEQPGPSDAAEQREFAEALDRALEGLPAKYRPVLVLRLRHGLAPADIAHSLGRPPGTVRAQLSRGLEQVRRALPVGFGALLAALITPVRGLAAIRADVLSQVPVGAALASTSAGTIISAILMKKTLTIVVAALAIGSLVYFATSTPELEPPSDIAMTSPEAGESDAQERAVGSAASERAEVDEPAAESAPEVPAEPVVLSDKISGGDSTLIVRVRYREDRSAAIDVPVILQSGLERMAWGRRRVVRTDAQGVAVFEGLPIGGFQIRTGLGGERDHQISAPGTSTVTLAIPNGFALQGQVVDGQGAAVVGANIWLSDPWDSYRGEILTQTGSDGRFELGPIKGERHVGASAEGFVPSPLTRVSGEPGDVQRVRIELVAGGVGGVSGTVREPSGRPIVSAWVLVGADRTNSRVRSSDGNWKPGPPPREAVTDEGGRFRVDRVPPGARIVQIRADGFAPYRSELDVLADLMATVDITMTRGATVAGTVRRVNGEPVPDAMVYSKPTLFAGVTALADKDGRYELVDLAGGEIEIRVRKDELRGYARLELEPEVDHSHDIEVEPKSDEPTGAMVLRGRGVDAAGEPLSNWRLVVTQAGGLAGRRVHGRIKSDGSFAMSVPWPVVAIAANPPGAYDRFPPIFVDQIDVASGDVLLQRGDALDSAGAIRGRVVDSVGQAAAARVEVWHHDARLYAAIDNDPDTGEFRFDHVQPGVSGITVQCRDHPWIRVGKREVQAGRVLDLGNLVVQAGGWVGGTLSVSAGALPGDLRFNLIRDAAQVGVVQYADGRYRSAALAPGDDYLLTVMGDRIVTQTKQFSVTAGNTTNLDFVCRPAALRVLRFEFAPGKQPPAWFGIRVVSATGSGPNWMGGPSSDDPRTVRASVPVGTYAVQMYGPAGDIQTWALRVSSLADASPIVYRVD